MIGLVRRLLAPRAAAVESRHLRIEGREIAYSLRRSQRRTLAMRVDDRGVHVAVPLRTTAKELEAFLDAHQSWLLDHLAIRAERAALQGFVPCAGSRLPVFGVETRLRIDPTARCSRWEAGEGGHDELVLGRTADPAGAIVKALRERALPRFRQRVESYCVQLGVATPEVRLSSARTRWGSCSSRSGIRLHWRLIHLDPALIDYVVAHEVAHLLEMNHSPRFWTIVETLYPRWREARREINVASRTLPVIQPGSGTAPTTED